MTRKNGLWINGEKFAERKELDGSVTRYQKSKYKWPKENNPFY